MQPSEKETAAINENYFYCIIIYNQQHIVLSFNNILITVNFN